MWSSIKRHRAIRILYQALLIAAVACVLGGCTTTDSDIPWNAPQPWEGSPFIPGMSGG